MKFTNIALKSSISLSSFLRATTLLATLYGVKVDGQIQLAVGYHHTCAFEPTSTSLKCWGDNNQYQLNTGDNTNRFNPIDVVFSGLTPVVAEAGGNSLCMIGDAGGVKCVGYNYYGQLGIGSTNTPITSPEVVKITLSSEKVLQISVGIYHACIIYIQGGLSCTGNNDHGQLGLNDNDSRNTPTSVNLNNNAENVAVGHHHTCIIDIEDSLLCMGRNDKGQLGLNDNTNRNTPAIVNLSGKTVVKLACGNIYTCIIDDVGAVLCMGENKYGQLGLGNNDDVNSPTLVPNVVSNVDNDAIEIAAGGEHTCFILSDDTLWCMGYNYRGQLGNGGTTNSNTPVKVNLPFTPVDIALGNNHSCVSTTNALNQIYCWGFGGRGQLGQGGTLNKNTPTLVQSLDWPTSAPVITVSPSAQTASPTAVPIASPTQSPATAPPTKAPTPSITPAPTITLPGRNEWFIYNTGNATEQATSKDTILISLPFNASNRDIGALVFREDCMTPFDSSSYFSADTTPKTSTQPDGFIQFNTTLEMNVTAINGTEYWNAFTDGTRGGWVEACIETYLSFMDDPNLGNDDAVQKLTFKNNVLNISVSLTANYDVDQVSIVRKDATEEDVNTDYSEFIRAFECEQTNPYAPVTGKTYNQGDEITICVTDESGGVVQVEEFVDLVVAQEGVSDYNFILNTLYNPDITSPECLDATASERRVCFAKIRALARFFEGEAPKDLTISGSVYVIRDGRRVRRNLRMALPVPEKTNEEDHDALALVSGRRAEEEEEGSGQFHLRVSLASADDSAATSSRNIVKSAAVAGLMSMTVGVAFVI